MTLFRVHFTDGTFVDVYADSPKEARDAVKDKHKGFVAKIKVVREKGNADA